MTDPMSALVGLQAAHRLGAVPWELGLVHKSIRYTADQPEGVMRVTYAKVRGENVDAMVQVIIADHYKGMPCFQIAYAVAEEWRGRGYAKDLAEKALAELRHGMKTRAGLEEFYVEAMVADSNKPSQRVAANLFPESPRPCTDQASGEPALHYIKKIGPSDLR